MLEGHWHFDDDFGGHLASDSSCRKEVNQVKPWGTLIFRGLPVVDKSTKQLPVSAEKSGTKRWCYREAARGFCHVESLALCSREVPLSWQGGQQPAGVTQGVECEEVGTSFGTLRCLGSERWFLEGDVIFLLVLLIWDMLGETQSGVIEEASGSHEVQSRRSGRGRAGS